MPRAVISPARARLAQPTEDSPVYGTRAGGRRSQTPGDAYSERLIKYVPGEAIAFFLAFSSAKGIADSLLIVLLVTAAAGAVLYSLNRNAALPAKVRELPALAALYTFVAFVAWALGTSQNVQDFAGVTQQVTAVIMGAVAFLLPAVTEAIARARTPAD